ncbi:hypothetical protein [Dysgonomonas sp. 520]|uniref:hypothetical protein n=1 Tax=Dysgonomonas sp. 520 TaxID=2302931 RepID=UPI0013D6B0FA|nr:hypothetical protein [Dysgonomonas sp. 520]
MESAKKRIDRMLHLLKECKTETEKYILVELFKIEISFLSADEAMKDIEYCLSEIRRLNNKIKRIEKLEDMQRKIILKVFIFSISW